MIGEFHPEGRIKGNIDDLFLDTRGQLVWVKEANPGKTTGWVALGHVVPLSDRVSTPRDPKLRGKLAGSPWDTCNPMR